MTIRSFGNKLTEKIFLGYRDRETATFPRNIVKTAQRKLDMLDAANEIKDLQSPPGNRLEKLSGDLQNFWSIRINNRWRIIFQWTEQGPSEVQILDYH